MNPRKKDGQHYQQGGNANSNRQERNGKGDNNGGFSNAGKQLMLISLLAKDRVISNNGKAFLKELILRRDKRVGQVLQIFENRHITDKSNFLEKIHELILDESRSFYDDLFADTSLEVGKMLSKVDRERQELNTEKSLIYGEVDYISFYRVLRKIKPEAGWTFYDLGSGTAKAVMAARFTQDFGKCVGIEILPSLHKQASIIVDRFKTNYANVLSTGLDQDVEVYEGSFLDHDWSDGNVVFANSTCFDEGLMDDMSRQAESMRPGSFFVTFTKGLTSNKFEVLERKRYRMSWGPATVFIHRRLGYDGRPVGGFQLCTLPSDNIEYDDEVANGADISSPDESDNDNDGDDNDDDDDDDDDAEDNDDGDEEDTSSHEDEDQDDADDEDDYEDGDADENDDEVDQPDAKVAATTSASNTAMRMHPFMRSSSYGNSETDTSTDGPSYAWRPPQPPASELTYNLRPPPVDLKMPRAVASASSRVLDSPQDSELLKRKIRNSHLAEAGRHADSA